jgi:RNA polymerase sigma-70 factor (ECF subfamily)
MSEATNPEITQLIEQLYRNDSRRILATLIRLLGDFDLAEDALQEAFRTAAEQWPRDGVPANPRPWLISTGRFKAVDTLRRRIRYANALTALAAGYDNTVGDPAYKEYEELADDRLRLIFTCCHPALPQEARVALTLREVCGLTTEAIAHAYLTTPTTLAQRIVRAKAKIREARIPYAVPEKADLPERLDAVLQVIYLVFNEGYSASSGDTLTRPDLSAEAIRLGRLLVELLPQAEAQGLLALMLLNEARRAARTTPDGELIPLDEQDRSLWQAVLIQEGVTLVQQALNQGPVGAYTLQAAIAAVHAAAPTFAATNWAQIIAFHDLLLQVTPSAVVELNRAVAVAMRDGPAAGLALIDAIWARGELTKYHLTHAARADLYRRLGEVDAARIAYKQAIALTEQGPQRRFLEQRLAHL